LIIRQTQFGRPLTEERALDEGNYVVVGKRNKRNKLINIKNINVNNVTK